MPLNCHPVVHSFGSFDLVLHDLLTPYLSTGCCIRSFDVYVHMHILFTISDWDVNVLFSDSTTNKFCQLAYDLFVSLYCSAFYVSCASCPQFVQLIQAVHRMLFCRMVARYAPPISYNFLNLIRLGGNVKTTFEKVIA
jgi:hypothetical protein